MRFIDGGFGTLPLTIRAGGNKTNTERNSGYEVKWVGICFFRLGTSESGEPCYAIVLTHLADLIVSKHAGRGRVHPDEPELA
jgi:hypothetical protein